MLTVPGSRCASSRTAPVAVSCRRITVETYRGPTSAPVRVSHTSPAEAQGRARSSRAMCRRGFSAANVALSGQSAAEDTIAAEIRGERTGVLVQVSGRFGAIGFPPARSRAPLPLSARGRRRRAPRARTAAPAGSGTDNGRKPFHAQAVACPRRCRGVARPHGRAGRSQGPRSRPGPLRPRGFWPRRLRLGPWAERRPAGRARGQGGAEGQPEGREGGRAASRAGGPPGRQGRPPSRSGRPLRRRRWPPRPTRPRRPTGRSPSSMPSPAWPSTSTSTVPSWLPTWPSAPPRPWSWLPPPSWWRSGAPARRQPIRRCSSRPSGSSRTSPSRSSPT